MLEIHMIDQDEPAVCFLTLEELLGTAHVIGEVPFIKPRKGALLNLTAVTRIIEGPDDAPIEETLNVTVPRRPPGGSAQWREG